MAKGARTHAAEALNSWSSHYRRLLNGMDELLAEDAPLVARPCEAQWRLHGLIENTVQARHLSMGLASLFPHFTPEGC